MSKLKNNLSKGIELPQQGYKSLYLYPSTVNLRLRTLFLLSFCILFCVFNTPTQAQDQTFLFEAHVLGADAQALIGANVQVDVSNAVFQTNELGLVSITLPRNKDVTIKISYLGYKTLEYKVLKRKPSNQKIILKLELTSQTTQEVVVRESAHSDRMMVGITSISPKSAVALPSAFGDFNKILATLPGVVSNNELSSTYNVRGGNYDENLVYVNGFEIYRPNLVRAGQQEGLSFVHTAMVSSVQFSAGGWPARYGDKLASVLQVQYKTPQKFGGQVQLSLLSSQIQLEGTNPNKRLSWNVGYRYKSARYLLNTLPVQGQYFPQFHDVQTYLEYNLTKKNSSFPLAKRSTLGFLGSYAYNNYEVIPSAQEVSFGTQSQVLRLFVLFAGKESMTYGTAQGGLKWSYWMNPKWKTEWFAGTVQSREKEQVDVEGGYRLSEYFPNPSGVGGQEGLVLGLGTQFQYARNFLDVQTYALEHKSYYQKNSKLTLEWGLKVQEERIKDQLWQYGFVDSADYVQLDPLIRAQNQLNSHRYQSYGMATHRFDSAHTLSYGLRLGTWSVNQEILWSPSVQYAFKPVSWKRDFVFKTGFGWYRQAPFYREMRDFQGQLNTKLLAQNSVQLTFGSDYLFQMWNRSFRFTAEAYYKYLWNVVPFDVDNVRIRYYAQNSAIAYATGLDMRVHGEFVKGVESWFSLGLMQTQEKVEGDKRGWIARPTNQLLTFGIFFQDQLAKYPSVKFYLNTIYGSGLPFGPPNQLQARNEFSMPSYKRIDIGISKVISFNDKTYEKSWFESISIGLEVLNVIGANNTISYIWIKDVQNTSFGVPNTLSQRFFNAKVLVQF